MNDAPVTAKQRRRPGRKGRPARKAKTPAPAQPREARSHALSDLERELKVKFRNKKLLEQALTHPSFTHETKGEGHNERLEFLGDSFLGLVISHLLFLKNAKADEGELTKTKSYLVSAKFLSQIAERLQLGKYLRIGRGEKGAGQPSTSMVSDAFEALLGALYLDQGYEKASKFVERLYLPHLRIAEQEEENFKGVLQEVLQRKYKEHPHYELVAEHGPDHSKVFEVQVLFRGKVFGMGKGKSKKEAEKEAAREALVILDRD